jgi:integrase
VVYSREIIPTNPITGLEKPGGEKSRERVLTNDELVRVWNGCEPGPFGSAIKVLMLTGARSSEIFDLKWGEIEGPAVKLDGARTKNGQAHVIHLSAPALDIIEAMPRVGDYVFSLDGGKKPIRGGGGTRAKERLTKTAGLVDWRVHDMRRTLSTGLNELGVEPHVVEAILGHTVKGVAGVYNRAKYEALKKAALEAWGAHVMALIERREPGKVIPM